jgi:hypothetical protein
VHRVITDDRITPETLEKMRRRGLDVIVA